MGSEGLNGFVWVRLAAAAGSRDFTKANERNYLDDGGGPLNGFVWEKRARGFESLEIFDGQTEKPTSLGLIAKKKGDGVTAAAFGGEEWPGWFDIAGGEPLVEQSGFQAGDA